MTGKTPGWDDWSDPDSDSDSDADADVDPRLQAGVEHLQRAAHEMIAATRALLDVAEELVDDPKAAAGVVELLGSFSPRRARSTTPSRPSSASPCPDPRPTDRAPPVSRRRADRVPSIDRARRRGCSGDGG